MSLQKLADLWLSKAMDFLHPDEMDMYDRCVNAALEDPKTAQLLDKRHSVTKSSVHRRMHEAPYEHFVIGKCQGAARRRFDESHSRLNEIQDRHWSVKNEIEWNWWITCSLVLTSSIALLIVGGLYILLVALFLTTVVVFGLFWRGTAVWFNLRQSLIAGGLGISWAAQRCEVGIRAVQWGKLLHEEGTGPVATQLVRHMLGDDPDSVFIPDTHKGLRAPRDPDYTIENVAFNQLKQKLRHIDYGTIAICGPRGVGKTTLLEECVKQSGFGVIAQAPATYTPHDFLLSLSVRLCEDYMRNEGYAVPRFARLSIVRRFLRRFGERVNRLVRWSVLAVPAVALVTFSLSSPVRSLYNQYATSVSESTKTHAEVLYDHAVDIWNSNVVAVNVVLAIAGIALWTSRNDPWLQHSIRTVRTFGFYLIGLLLVSASAVSFAFDEQVHNKLKEVHPEVILKTVALLTIWILFRNIRDSGRSFTLGSWNVPLNICFGILSAAAGLYILMFLFETPDTRTILSDSENLLRLSGVVFGLILIRVGEWRPKSTEPKLVTKCRNHLYRLQTIQMSTNMFSPGTSQLMSLGTSHTTSVSTIPPSFPELVEEFRSLLTSIAFEKARQNNPVVIAIDEVDRIGSETQALEFLSEIKAILGVPHVYYLISVAEDVGATFVRRGLPYRDVTDSSLDDIIHVHPGTLNESRSILAKRASTLTDPYVMLAHGLSGGILRDLLRYGLQIREIQEKTQSFELTDISRHLILNELSETLSGFRTLLAKQQWSHETIAILGALRTLIRYLRNPCPCTEEKLRHSLEEFALDTVDHPSNEMDDARQLIDEAAVYSYFSLTLLDIFSANGFKYRADRAYQHGSDGDPERFAEARQELSISPYSALPVIDNIRIAWGLVRPPTTHGRVPPPRAPECHIHSV